MLLSEASANLKIAASPIFPGSFLPVHGAIDDLDVRGYSISSQWVANRFPSKGLSP
jgi:hypothetical protein